MISEPKLENRSEQPYVGIRLHTTQPELKNVIPQTMGEVFGWLEKRGIAPNGAPFVRYHVINMEENGQFDVEIGVPVANPLPGNGRVTSGVLPAGRYASLIFYGPFEQVVEGNMALIDWGKEQGIQWDAGANPPEYTFASRLETYITDPAEEPDPQKWETEVAIKVA